MSFQNTTRRDFLKILGLGACSFVTSKSLLAQQNTSQKLLRKPNIILILADDMGYGDLNCQNPESKIPTPNLDTLAFEGVRFTDAHSPSAVCSPTRYGILTGRYCWRTKLKNWVLWPWDKPLIEPQRLTLPGFLKKHDYHTGCIGKWHLGWDWPTTNGKEPEPSEMPENIDFTKPIKNGPLRHGFDYYFGVDVPNFPPYCFIENEHTIGIPTERKPKSMYGSSGPMLKGWDLVEIMPKLTERAVKYIDQKTKKQKPFFLYFSLTAPHNPIVPAPAFKGKSKAGEYGDFVYQVDDTVGKILQAVKKNNIERDTLIIFTSDNGSPARANSDEDTGSVRRFGHNPSWILRGIKADAWDGGHRIPFVARWPGQIKPNSTNPELTCLVDFMATIATVLGDKLPHNAGEDSYNILPALLGQKLLKPIREALVQHSGDGMFAIRQGRWKLIIGGGSGGFSEPVHIEPKPGEPEGQLYDLDEDICESKNLYNQHPDIVKNLTELLDKYSKEGRSAPVM
ncbi:MAG: arylsulfatase [Planctomycetota bacterium]